MNYIIESQSIGLENIICFLFLRNPNPKSRRFQRFSRLLFVRFKALTLIRQLNFYCKSKSTTVFENARISGLQNGENYSYSSDSCDFQIPCSFHLSLRNQLSIYGLNY